jgi:uncharacterized membrane protein
MESKLVVLGFEGEFGAEGMLNDFYRMQEEGLIEIEDAVVASRGVGNHIEVTQTKKLTGKFAKKGAGIGFLAGLLLGGPLLAAAGGAAVGAVTGSLKDNGIDDKFIEETQAWIAPEHSALFLLVKNAKAEEILEKLKPFKAQVLSTNLSPEAQARLEKALEEEGK